VLRECMCACVSAKLWEKRSRIRTPTTRVLVVNLHLDSRWLSCAHARTHLYAFVVLAFFTCVPWKGKRVMSKVKRARAMTSKIIHVFMWDITHCYGTSFLDKSLIFRWYDDSRLESITWVGWQRHVVAAKLSKWGEPRQAAPTLLDPVICFVLTYEWVMLHT